MNYTKADLRKFFLAGRRFGLLENEDNTPMNFNEFFDVYLRIQEDITYVTYSEEEIVDTIKQNQKDHLTELMEISQEAGLYDQHKEQWKECISQKKEELRDDKSPKTDFLGRNIEPIFTEVDIADAIYISKFSGKRTHEIIEQIKDRKWPRSK